MTKVELLPSRDCEAGYGSGLEFELEYVWALTYTPWPNKNASILFGIIFQKLINKNEKFIL